MLDAKIWANVSRPRVYVVMTSAKCTPLPAKVDLTRLIQEICAYRATFPVTNVQDIFEEHGLNREGCDKEGLVVA